MQKNIFSYNLIFYFIFILATQSEQLLKTFEEKGSVLVETLVTQITSCFDKYTDVIKQCLENQTRQICDIIAQQVQVPVTEENQDNVVEEQTASV